MSPHCDCHPGKSTLIAFTLRFYDPDQGTVLLDGQDLKDINVHSLRGAIAYVCQEPTLFKGSMPTTSASASPTPRGRTSLLPPRSAALVARWIGGGRVLLV